ncbi:glycoside hydrolase family 65 protein [Fodinicola acaciae]|uniref:glycoside hydrolase family 65 protein n=1 Tax=Fodinicola acaciae TaxID=2681555 RepID=UPI0013D6A077|nr:glycoside hydrolase family 65 protein [Fodinicola acaciae]
MIPHPAYDVDPWRLVESALEPDMLPQSESVFALSNGHIGWRGNLDEGEPHGLPGTYLNGVHEIRPLPHAEAGYGYPESGQTILNVSNGKLIRLLVDDEPFDIRYGVVHAHRRELDFRTGLLDRQVEWESPAGQVVRVRSQRLVSFTHRAIAAIRYEVEAVGEPARIVLQSELVANEQLPVGNGDPRASAMLHDALVSEDHGSRPNGAYLVHHTRRSEIRVGAGMVHTIDGPEKREITSDSAADLGRTTVAVVLQPGEKLTLVKYVAYGWSGRRSLPAVRDQVAAALVAAHRAGWDGLRTEQREFLDQFWTNADIQLDGDPELQQGLRFGLFHVLQASARSEGRAVPAKGLTGPGYDGHTFWDAETFVLPVLTLTYPEATKHALRWRHSTLPSALDRARQLGFAGAAFPWRTIDGAECSGYWPAGTAALHVNADIADAVVNYCRVTDDQDFAGGLGMDIVTQTARLWMSVGHRGRDGEFRIDGITGPDEYSAIADNNVYTNLMAQQNLRAAAQLAKRFPGRAKELDISAAEAAGWAAAADAMYVPYDEKIGVHPQSDGFTRHQFWDFANTGPEHYPLLLHFPYLDLYRKQVVKQADLVLAMQQYPEAFTAAQKARNFAYYEAITVRDSSLSAGTQAAIAAEVGHLELAYDYLAEATLMDLRDLEHNTSDGLHIAALASGWNAMVAGFGGLRVGDECVSFAPRLPPALTGFAFRVCVRGTPLRVEVRADSVRYTALDGQPTCVRHHGETITLEPDTPVTMPIPPLPEVAPVHQPPGREPSRRRPIR